MRNTIVWLAGVMLLAFAFGPGTAKQAAPDDEDKEPNLLVNGSFEEGPDTGNMGFTWYNEAATDIKGWTVTRGQLSYIGSYWQHADGKRSLDMHGGPGFGGIKQAFKTKKGQKYRVTFSLAGNPLGKNPKKELGVSAAGKEEKFVFDATDKTIKDMGWTTQVWDFVATGDETTLEFRTLMTDDGDCGPALDKVSVKPVDE
jgi:choice-of-anchor C domain-containing protein